MWSYIKNWFKRLLNRNTEEQSNVKEIKETTKNKRGKHTRTKPLKLWGDTPKTTGVIVQYKDGSIRYNYHYNTKIYKGFQSSYDNCLEFAKKFKKMDYNISRWDDVRTAVLQNQNKIQNKSNQWKPTYMTKTKGKYLIQKIINGKHYCFGYWRTKQEAEEVVEWLKGKNWDTDYASNNARGYSQEEYQAEIRSYMKIDEEIQNKLGE